MLAIGTMTWVCAGIAAVCGLAAFIMKKRGN